MQTQVFELERDFVELNQLLKLTGLSHSGGAGKQLVASGVVSVDGVQELRKTAKIRAGQMVNVGSTRIEVRAALENQG
jgi:ribosome-associated protein